MHICHTAMSPPEYCLDASFLRTSCVWALWSFVINSVFNAGFKRCSQGFTPNDFDWSQGIGPDKKPPLLSAVAYYDVDADLQTRLEMIKWMLRHGADPKRTHREGSASCFTVRRGGIPLFSVAYAGHSVISFTFALLEELRKMTETELSPVYKEKSENFLEDVVEALASIEPTKEQGKLCPRAR